MAAPVTLQRGTDGLFGWQLRADRAILANLQTPSRHISAPRNKAQSRTAWQV